MLRIKTLPRVIFIVLLPISFFLSSCSGVGDSQKTLRLGLFGKANNLNPLVARDPVSYVAIDAIFARLTRWNDKWEMEPLLCEKIPNVGDGSIVFVGQNMLQIRYVLRQDLEWSDGSPINSYDVLYLYQLSYNPLFAKYNQEMISTIKKANVTDPMTIIYTMEPPEFDFSPVPLSRKALADKPMTGSNVQIAEIFYKNATYSGPFMLESFSPRKIILKRNPKFFGKKTPFEKLEIDCYNDEREMTKDLEEKKIDVAWRFAHTGAKMPEIKKHLKRDIRPSAEQMFLLANMRGDLAGDPRLRKAILLAVDRKQLSLEIFGNPDFVPNSWLPVRHPYFIDVLAQYSFDTKKAESLIQDMGYKKNSQGKYEKSGILLAPTVMISADRPLDYKVALFLKASLEKVGVGMEIKAFPEELFRQYLKSGNFKDFAIDRIEIPPWTAPRYIFSKAMIPSESANGKGMNYGAWIDEENERLCELYRKAIDPSEKSKILKLHQENFASQLPMIPIINIGEMVIYDRTIANIKPRGFGSITWNVEEWTK